MAQEIREFNITVPAGTAQSANWSSPMHFPPRRVTGLHIRVPPGPRGEVGFRIGSSGAAVIPLQATDWIVTDDRDVEWELDGYIDSGSWDLFAYNTGQYPHTLNITFLLDTTQQQAASSTPAPIDPSALGLVPAGGTLPPALTVPPIPPPPALTVPPIPPPPTLPPPPTVQQPPPAAPPGAPGAPGPTPSPAGGFLMALTDGQQQEMYDKLNQVWAEGHGPGYVNQNRANESDLIATIANQVGLLYSELVGPDYVTKYGANAGDLIGQIQQNVQKLAGGSSTPGGTP